LVYILTVILSTNDDWLFLYDLTKDSSLG